MLLYGLLTFKLKILHTGLEKNALLVVIKGFLVKFNNLNFKATDGLLRGQTDEKFDFD